MVGARSRNFGSRPWCPAGTGRAPYSSSGDSGWKQFRLGQRAGVADSRRTKIDRKRAIWLYSASFFCVVRLATRMRQVDQEVIWIICFPWYWWCTYSPRSA